MTRAAHQNGFILLPVVLAITLIATIALLVNTQSAIHNDVASGIATAAEADQVARAGLAHAEWWAGNNGCAGDGSMASVPFGPAGAHSYSGTVDSAATGTSSYTLTPDRDTWIREATPDDNFSTDNVIIVHAGSGIDFRGLYHFDLSSIPTGSRVVAATLYLYTLVNDDAADVQIHSITADWAEGTVTWNSFNDAYQAEVAARIPLQPEPDTWIEIPLTALAQTWVNLPSTNHGILLTAASSNVESKYTSRKYSGSERPYLVVTVADAPVTPLKISATGTLAADALGETVSRTVRREAVAAWQRPASITLQLSDTGGGRDTMLDSFYLSRNFGGTSYLTITSQPDWLARPVIQFDLPGIPPGARVLEARLELYANNVTTGGSATAHRVIRDWVEGTRNGGGIADGATWETWDGNNAWAQPGGEYAAEAVAETYIPADTDGWGTAWDIAPLVQDWIDGTVPNYGLMLRSDGVLDNASFNAREGNNPLTRPRITITFACECGSPCLVPQGSGNVLMLVGDDLTPGLNDIFKRDLLESWGYTVKLLDEGASQGTYDSEFSLNDVVYVSGSVNSGEMGQKLKDAPIAIVNEDGTLNIKLGIAQSNSWPVGDSITVTDTSHYITAPFATGSLAIYDAGMGGLTVSGSTPPDLQGLADWGSTAGLVTLEAGATDSSGVPAAARRVMLPFGPDSNMDWRRVNANGRLILHRALQWAMGNEGTVALGFYRDEFNSFICDAVVDYSGSDGSLDWSTQSWSEIGESINSCTGGVKLETDLADTRIRISSPDKAIQRQVDLSAFTTAWLHFDYRRVNLNASTDLLSVSVSTDGGTNWDEVAQLAGPADDAAYLNAEIDISAYAGADTMIRFMQINTFSGSEIVYIDNVQIDDIATTPPPLNVLLVVGDAGALTQQELDRQTLIESWGYSVTLIGASEPQANFDAAVATADVAYVVEQQQSTVLGTKLRNAAIGVINEEAELRQDIGLSANRDWPSTRDTVDIVDNTHYITSPFATGLLTIATAPIEVVSLSGQLAGGLQVLGEHDWGGPQTSLSVIDTGGDLYGGGTAAGRRVQLPWGRTGFDINALNTNGLKLMQRAIEWGISGGGGGGGGGGSPPICDGNFADDFETDDYSGSSGTMTWAGAWTEINENGNPGNGDEIITTDNGDLAVRIQDNDGGGEGIERAADLSAHMSATLGLEYRRQSLDDANDYVTVEISSDGGANWSELDRFDGPGTDDVYVPVSYDITSYIGSDTRIRFLSSPNLGGQDRVWFDNVEIQVNGCVN